MTKSSASINEKVSQNIRQRDEGESDPEQADDIMDDSASSYYTALCSLSEYGEDIDDRTHTLFTECLVEGELLDCTTSLEGITSKSTKTPMVQCIKDTFLSNTRRTWYQAAYSVLTGYITIIEKTFIKTWCKTAVVTYRMNKCGFAICKYRHHTKAGSFGSDLFTSKRFLKKHKGLFQRQWDFFSH